MGSGAGQGKHQIGEVADAVGLSLRTIRYYGEEGLVPPSGRTSGGFRLYTDNDIERFRLIKQMKPLDFSLDEMRELLTILDHLSGGVEGEERAQLLERLGVFASVVEERCIRLREQLAIADAFADQLRRVVSASSRHPSMAQLGDEKR